MEARTRGKQTIYAIYGYTNDAEFDKLLQRNVSQTEARYLKEAVEKMKKESGLPDDLPGGATSAASSKPTR